MDRTPDEIKKGLEMCTHGADCSHCPYTLYECSQNQMEKDAIALIQQLQAQNAEKDETIQQLESGLLAQADVIATMGERIQQLEAERDAAVAGLKKAANEKGECFECKWYNGKHCTHQDYKTICSSSDDKWQWRGVQKEE